MDFGSDLASAILLAIVFCILFVVLLTVSFPLVYYASSFFGRPLASVILPLYLPRPPTDRDTIPPSTESEIDNEAAHKGPAHEEANQKRIAKLLREVAGVLGLLLYIIALTTIFLTGNLVGPWGPLTATLNACALAVLCLTGASTVVLLSRVVSDVRRRRLESGEGALLKDDQDRDEMA